MEKEKPKSIYPEASKGWLKTKDVDSTAPKKRSPWRMHDFEPSALLAMTIGIAFLIGIIGFTAFLISYKRSHQTALEGVAIAIAKKLADRNATETYEKMESNIKEGLRGCKHTPEISVTHYFQDDDTPLRTEMTYIDPSQDVTSALERAVERASNATRNELNVYCPR